MAENGIFMAGEAVPQTDKLGKKISTKGHEADLRQDIKRYPRRATKDDEGPLRGWRSLKRGPPRVEKGIQKSNKLSVKG